MANVLIVYATRHGQTEKIAHRIGATLAARGHAPTLFNADHADAALTLDPYQVVFVGAPIHAGGYPKSVVAFARKHRGFLARVPSALFSVGLAIVSRTSDGRAETMPIVDKLIAETGWRPRRVELIAGALKYSLYNFVIRFIMRRIAARAGGDTDTSHDYEYTDWDAVDRFAVAFVAEALAPHAVDEPPASPVGSRSYGG